MLQDLERWGAEAIFYSSILFITVVSLFWPWWRSQLGWTFAAKSIALAAATLPLMLNVWLDGELPHWLSWVSVAAIWAVPVILAWRAIILYRVQRKGYLSHIPPAIRPDAAELWRHKEERP